MGAGDGPLAWEYLRRSPEYRRACRERRAPGVVEEAPFVIRVQTRADLEAARFSLLAWEDPGTAGASPFWVEAPMLDGEPVDGTPPLLALLRASGAWIEGLRLIDGRLVLKIERGGGATQVMVPGGGPFHEDAGLVVRLEYGLPLPVTIARLKDLWSAVLDPGPWRRQVRKVWIASCWLLSTADWRASRCERSRPTFTAPAVSRPGGTPTAMLWETGTSRTALGHDSELPGAAGKRRVGSVYGGHHVGASARSLGGLTKL